VARATGRLLLALACCLAFFPSQLTEPVRNDILWAKNY
jgi:hypothetical protein